MDDILKRAVKALNIDKPIMKTQLTDQRLKIYLYGGQMLEYSEETTQLPAELQKILENPQMFDRGQLRILAQALGIEGFEGMNKKELVRLVSKAAHE